MIPPARVAMVGDRRGPHAERVQALAHKLSLPLYDTPASLPQHYDFYLTLETTDGETPRLALGARDPSLGKPLSIDFIGGTLGHRRQFGGGRGQALARAVGLKGGARPRVVDATGGMGRDAFVLASLGATVTVIERSMILMALLEDAVARAADIAETASIVARLHLLQADAIDWLRHCPAEQRPEVVYLDPMYPHRTKSALVKKEMRLLRGLVGDDSDADQLLAAALHCATKRVVVKRPKGAPIITGAALSNIRPASAVASRNTRYDLYPLKE